MLRLEKSYKTLTDLSDAKLPPAAPSTGHLLNHMPQVEKTHLHHTEADVLRPSFLYLLHPVNSAVSQLLDAGTLDFSRYEDHLVCKARRGNRSTGYGRLVCTYDT